MPVLDRSAIDPDADRVVRKLTRAGYKAYLVGGCVRDLLVGETPKDFDVATSATPNEIRATFRNCRIIGRRFRLAHVFFGSKIIETATFRANPRDDDDRDLLIRRDNVFGTEAEDARRRDFTINGLFYDVESEEVLDHVGGLADLEARLVRTIGDPDIRFQEDPVRMLRAIKFAARLRFDFEEATWRALLRWRSEISKCAPPRVLEEVYRLLRGGAARRSFELMVEANVLAVLSTHAAGLLEGPGAPTRSLQMPAAAPHSTVARLEYDDEDPAEHDPDDPDRSEAIRGGGKASDDDSDLDMEFDSSGDHLDAEERIWHRVWADDPPARPPPVRAPRLSFLDENALTLRRATAWRALEKLDLAVKAGDLPSPAVALGAAVAPFIYSGADHEAKGGGVGQAVEEVLGPLISDLRVTRRDSERLRYLFTAHRRLVAAGRLKVPAELAGSHDVFEEAILLYTLVERALGNDATPPTVVATSERGGGAGGMASEGEDADRPHKRRRRRRGGRRRRAETTI